MASTTHVAGPAIYVTSQHDPKMCRVIQRCLICGTKLIDVDEATTAYAVTSETVGRNAPFTWAVPHMVRVNGNHSQDIGGYKYGADPKDLCIDLVEDDKW